MQTVDTSQCVKETLFNMRQVLHTQSQNKDGQNDTNNIKCSIKLVLI